MVVELHKDNWSDLEERNPYTTRREDMSQRDIDDGVNYDGNSQARFIERIRRMNQIMQIECNDKPTNLGMERLEDWAQILSDELAELEDVIDLLDVGEHKKAMVALADFIGDNIVYHTSEARRWGIPVLPVLHAIMDSQDSKLVNGKPVPGDRPGKFGKGPNYQPPEKDIAKILFGEAVANRLYSETQSVAPDLAEQIRDWANKEAIDADYAEDSLGELLQRLKKESSDPNAVNPTDDGFGDGLRRVDLSYHHKKDEINAKLAEDQFYFNKFLCPSCKNPISDEVAKQMFAEVLDSSRCPNCGMVYFFRDGEVVLK